MNLLARSFPQLLDALRKRLKHHMNVQEFNKLLNDLLDLFFYWVTFVGLPSLGYHNFPNKKFFCSSNTIFLSAM